MAKINIIAFSVLLILLGITSLLAQKYYKEYVTLTITIQKNNDAAKELERELKEKYEKELKEINQKYESIQEQEKQRNEEVNNINADYTNLRLRYKQMQREQYNNRETRSCETKADRTYDEDETERSWVLYRESVEAFRNELENLNSAYRSCYDLTVD